MPADIKIRLTVYADAMNSSRRMSNAFIGAMIREGVREIERLETQSDECRKLLDKLAGDEDKYLARWAQGELARIFLAEAEQERCSLCHMDSRYAAESCRYTEYCPIKAPADVEQEPK